MAWRPAPTTRRRKLGPAGVKVHNNHRGPARARARAREGKGFRYARDYARRRSFPRRRGFCNFKLQQLAAAATTVIIPSTNGKGAGRGEEIGPRDPLAARRKRGIVRRMYVRNRPSVVAYRSCISEAPLQSNGGPQRIKT